MRCATDRLAQTDAEIIVLPCPRTAVRPVVNFGVGQLRVKSADLKAGQSLPVYCDKPTIPERTWTSR
jgi:hypothetical protein